MNVHSEAERTVIQQELRVVKKEAARREDGGRPSSRWTSSMLRQVKDHFDITRNRTDRVSGPLSWVASMV